MTRREAWLGLILVLATGSSDVALASARAARGPQSEAGMSEDVRWMHERLIALSKGEGSMSELRIELMDGSGMSSHRSFHIEAGKLVSEEWKAPGAPMIRREGKVTDSRVVNLLEQLIAKRYWTFQGTRFVPDAPMFLFRFYYGDLKYVDFRCDAEELEKSDARGAIRGLFLQWVAETEMKIVPAQ